MRQGFREGEDPARSSANAGDDRRLPGRGRGNRRDQAARAAVSVRLCNPVGSREGISEQAVRWFVAALAGKHPSAVVVSGGARGVDSWAQSEAERRGLKVFVYPADWDRFGKSAGFRRNRDIVDRADIVVAFWNGTSRGTKHTIDLGAKHREKALFVYNGLDELTEIKLAYDQGDSVATPHSAAPHAGLAAYDGR